SARQPPGVLDVLGDRAGAQEAEPPGLLEDSLEAQACSAGTITTRRFGSSPSDVVETPSMALTVSCTTLRSAGTIGSSAVGTPACFTRSATSVAKCSRAARRVRRYSATPTRRRP